MKRFRTSSSLTLQGVQDVRSDPGRTGSVPVRPLPSRPVRSRRGSGAVFLCVILSALVAICFAFIFSSREYRILSQTDALMHLSGDSVLSEYDRDIYDDYHLFLLRGNDRDLSGKLRHYLAYTFDALPSADLSDVSAKTGPFSVMDPQLVREQILDHMKSGGGLSSAGQANDPGISDTGAGRALRHGPTIASLPSRQLPQQDFLTRLGTTASQIQDLEKVFTDGTHRYLLSSYILDTFNSTAQTASEDHFFFREAEYILQGELSDRENRRKTASALRILRLSLNFAYLYTDPKKQEALTAAAEIIAPGPAAAAVQAVLASAWAYAESVNDAELLMKGYRVPLMKDKTSWAISLENLLRQVSLKSLTKDPEDLEEDPGKGRNKGPDALTDLLTQNSGDDTSAGTANGSSASLPVIHPEENKGLDYQQYLRILLFLQDENLMCARILDLIQINMRKNVDGSFLIAACSTGISMDVTVNHRTRKMEKLYQARPSP